MIISHAPDEPLIALTVSPQVEQRGTRRTMALLWWHVSPAAPHRPTPATPRPSSKPTAADAAPARRARAGLGIAGSRRFGRRSLCFGFIGFRLIWGQCKNGIITGYLHIIKRVWLV